MMDEHNLVQRTLNERLDRELLEENLERLKICGTCVHFVDMGEWSECDLSEEGDVPNTWHGYEVSLLDHCHFTPSRWKAYWERR